MMVVYHCDFGPGGAVQEEPIRSSLTTDSRDQGAAIPCGSHRRVEPSRVNASSTSLNIHTTKPYSLNHNQINSMNESCHKTR